MKRTKFLVAICSMLQITACGSSSTYRTALLGDMPAAFNPVDFNGYAGETIVSQICGRLTSVDDVLNIEPDLAASWDISPDRKRYVFHLKTDRRFHDGRAVGAEDVVYSLKRASPQDGIGHDWGAEVLSINALSPRDVEIVLKAGNPRFLFKLSEPRMCIVNAQSPAYVVDGIRVPDSPGNYEVESRDAKNRELILRAGRSGLIPPVERRIAVYFRSQSEAVAMFKGGSLDDLSFYLLSPQEISQVADNSQMVPFPIYWTWFIHLNGKSKVFDKAKSRREFLARFDRSAFINAWSSPIHASTSLIPYGMQGHSQAADDPSPGIRPVGRQRVHCATPLRVAVIRGMPKEQELRNALSQNINSAADCGSAITFLEMADYSATVASGDVDIYVDAIDTNSNDPLGFYAYFFDPKYESIYRTEGDRDSFGKEFKKLYALPIEDRTQAQYDGLLKLFDDTHAGVPLGSPVFQFAYGKSVRSIHMNSLGMSLNRWAEIGR